MYLKGKYKLALRLLQSLNRDNGVCLMSDRRHEWPVKRDSENEQRYLWFEVILLTER